MIVLSGPSCSCPLKGLNNTVQLSTYVVVGLLSNTQGLFGVQSWGAGQRKGRLRRQAEEITGTDKSYTSLPE